MFHVGARGEQLHFICNAVCVLRDLFRLYLFRLWCCICPLNTHALSCRSAVSVCSQHANRSGCKKVRLNPACRDWEEKKQNQKHQFGKLFNSEFLLQSSALEIFLEYCEIWCWGNLEEYKDIHHYADCRNGNSCVTEKATLRLRAGSKQTPSQLLLMKWFIWREEV